MEIWQGGEQAAALQLTVQKAEFSPHSNIVLTPPVSHSELSAVKP